MEGRGQRCRFGGDVGLRSEEMYVRRRCTFGGYVRSEDNEDAAIEQDMVIEEGMVSRRYSKSIRSVDAYEFTSTQCQEQ